MPPDAYHRAFALLCGHQLILFVSETIIAMMVVYTSPPRLLRLIASLDAPFVPVRPFSRPMADRKNGMVPISAACETRQGAVRAGLLSVGVRGVEEHVGGTRGWANDHVGGWGANGGVRER